MDRPTHQYTIIMRKKIVAGNWKMNLNRQQAVQLVQKIITQKVNNNSSIIFAPSFVHLYKIAKLCRGFKGFSVAAQDCHFAESGPYTGSVSADMIKSCGAEYVILGHSERREYNKESNQIVKEKVNIALANQISVIFCCGETLSQRQSKIHFNWIKQQLEESIFHLSASKFSNIIVAYEPIWAIGTGVTASKDEAQEMHVFIRDLITEKYGVDLAEQIPILYGGSCKPSNAKDLFNQSDIDGGLIGGASLDSNDFLQILDAL